jgi:hypothetical protein
VTDASPKQIAFQEEMLNAQIAWDYLDGKIATAIDLCVAEVFEVFLHGKDSSREKWEALRNTFRTHGSFSPFRLRKAMWNTKYIDGTSMSDHIAMISNYKISLLEQKVEISEQEEVGALVSSLPTDKVNWDRVASDIERMDYDKITLDQVINMLLSEYERTASQVPKVEAGRETLAVATYKPTCYRCQEVGHISSECTKPDTRTEEQKCQGRENREKRKQGKKGGDRSSTTAAVVPIHLLAISPSVPTFPPSVPPAMLVVTAFWIVDSGSKIHVTGSRDSLEDFVSSPLEVLLADGSMKTCPGHGTVTIVTEEGILKVSNTYYLPDSPMNILSARRLTEKGATIVLTDQGCDVLKNGKKICSTTVENGLWVVRGKGGAQSRFVGAIPAMRLDQLWHRRLGHIAAASIRTMATKGSVKGLDGLRVSCSTTGEICSSCAIANSKQQPIKSSTHIRAKEYGEFHVDLGFSPEPTLGGRTVFILVVEDRSRTHTIGILQDKSGATVSSWWKSFMLQWELKYDKKVRKVTTDSENVFTGEKFTEHLEEMGIEHLLLAPYVHTSAGRVERPMQTLMRMVRAMLVDENLPDYYWGWCTSKI